MNRLLVPDGRPEDGYPLPEGYAERLLRAAGCTGAVLPGWRSGQGPRCRLCGTVAVIPTAALREALSAWRRPDPWYSMREHARWALTAPEAAGVVMSAGAALLGGAS